MFIKHYLGKSLPASAIALALMAVLLVLVIAVDTSIRTKELLFQTFRRNVST
ncbi:hypothetical protein [Coleofasciculus sp. F4-SAH-05]|uniref:hypothetical protein n=1 Tax=Coleofasciculus sp. F4-SAH-05 TaxID=3069525 RepID=UPI0032FE98F5